MKVVVSKKFPIFLETDGSGFWTIQKKNVLFKKLELITYEEDEEDGDSFGELRAVFDSRYWKPRKHGLIYTDRGWMKQFKALLRAFGFSKKEVDALSYSEQGMQGDNYVSLDAFGPFIKKFLSLKKRHFVE